MAADTVRLRGAGADAGIAVVGVVAGRVGRVSGVGLSEASASTRSELRVNAPNRE